jgi:DedD protein
MDSRAKQRLTGAIILVALFVLLVPELLTGPKGAANAPATQDDDGLRRYTIDLNAPSSSTAGQPSAQSAVTLPTVSQATTPGANERAQPGEAAAPEAPASSAAESAVRPEASTAAIPAAPRPASAAPAPGVATTTPAAPPAQAPREPIKPPVAAASGSFVVQLGSFGSRDNAQRLVRDMTAKGFATFIAPITTNGRELYRVRVGPTRDRAAAEALASQLKRMGQSGSIVPIP